MAFDITRAVVESIGGRTPIADRILSYLYFSRVDVLEQSAWDEFGTGVTLIGRKGGPDDRDGTILTCPLPGKPLPGIDAASTRDRRLDLARFIDLMAKIWAVSELDAARLRAPVHLVAYRPDPMARSLLAVLDSGGLHGRHALVYGPVGIEPVRPSGGIAVCSLGLSGGSRRAPRRWGAESMAFRIGPADRTATGMDLLESIELISSFVASGAIEPLDIRLEQGSDLVASASMELDATVLETGFSLPPGWEAIGPLGKPGEPTTWPAAIEALAAAIRRVRAAVDALWSARGQPRPGSAIVPLVFEGPAHDAGLLFAAPLPPGKAISAATAADSLLEAMNPAEPTGDVTVTGVVRRLMIGREEWSGSDSLPGVAAFVAQAFPECRVMGPAPEEAVGDPAGVARHYASAYLAAIRGAMRL